jgi:hypothetical protein
MLFIPRKTSSWKFGMGMKGIKVKRVIMAGKNARKIRNEILADLIVVRTSEKAITRNDEISQRFNPPKPKG